MKVIKLNLILIGLIISSGLTAENSGKDKMAESVVGEVLKKLSPGEWQASYRFTNYRTDGTEKSYLLDILAKNSRTIHIIFKSPATESGRQILNKDGEIWSYLPDSRKVVRLADRDSIANGDFNNADVMKLNWLEEYNVHVIKESEKQIVIDMTAKPEKATTYFIIRLWVNKKDNQPIQQYFYDNSGHHLKTLKYRDVKNFHGIIRPAQLVMENVVTGQRTHLEIMDFNKKENLPDSRFLQESLGK